MLASYRLLALQKNRTYWCTKPNNMWLASINHSNCYFIYRISYFTNRSISTSVSALQDKCRLFWIRKRCVDTQHEKNCWHGWLICCVFLHAQKPNLNTSRNFISILVTQWWINYFHGVIFSPQVPNLQTNIFIILG